MDDCGVSRRERSNLQMVNRRLERKVKEMMMQVDEEHHSMQDQKDQVRTHAHSTTCSKNLISTGRPTELAPGTCCFCLNPVRCVSPAVEPAPEGPEETDGRGGGGD